MPLRAKLGPAQEAALGVLWSHRSGPPPKVRSQTAASLARRGLVTEAGFSDEVRLTSAGERLAEELFGPRA